MAASYNALLSEKGAPLGEYQIRGIPFNKGSSSTYEGTLLLFTDSVCIVKKESFLSKASVQHDFPLGTLYVRDLISTYNERETKLESYWLGVQFRESDQKSAIVILEDSYDKADLLSKLATTFETLTSTMDPYHDRGLYRVMQGTLHSSVALGDKKAVLMHCRFSEWLRQDPPATSPSDLLSYTLEEDPLPGTDAWAVQTLLAQPCDPSAPFADLNATDEDSMTPLHLACEKGYAEIARCLVLCGASLDVANAHGDTPLHLAVQNAHVDIVRFLVENGASRSEINIKFQTPLLAALMHPCWKAPERKTPVSASELFSGGFENNYESLMESLALSDAEDFDIASNIQPTLTIENPTVVTSPSAGPQRPLADTSRASQPPIHIELEAASSTASVPDFDPNDPMPNSLLDMSPQGSSESNADAPDTTNTADTLDPVDASIAISNPSKALPTLQLKDFVNTSSVASSATATSSPDNSRSRAATATRSPFANLFRSRGNTPVPGTPVAEAPSVQPQSAEAASTRSATPTSETGTSVSASAPTASSTAPVGDTDQKSERELEQEWKNTRSRLKEIIDNLLQYNASTTETNIEGLGALHLLACSPVSEAVDVLESFSAQGADLNQYSDAVSVASPNKETLTPLHIVCASGNVSFPEAPSFDDAFADEKYDFLNTDLLKAFLHRGAHVNAATSGRAHTPLRILLGRMHALKAAGRAQDLFYAVLRTGCMLLVSYGARLRTTAATSAAGGEDSMYPLAQELGVLDELLRGAEMHTQNKAIVLPEGVKPHALHPYVQGELSSNIFEESLTGRYRTSSSVGASSAASGSSTCHSCGSNKLSEKQRALCHQCKQAHCPDCVKKRSYVVYPRRADYGYDSDEDDAIPSTAPTKTFSLASLRSAFSKKSTSGASKSSESGSPSSPFDYVAVCDSCFYRIRGAMERFLAERPYLTDPVLAAQYAASEAAKKRDEELKANLVTSVPKPTETKGLFGLTGRDNTSASMNVSEQEQRAQLFGLAGRQDEVTDRREKKDHDKQVREAADIMRRNRELLGERGSKIANLAERTERMADDAKNFADLAEQLKKKSAKSSWFPF